MSSRPTTPPSIEAFDRTLPGLGSRAFGLRLDRVRVRLAGLDDDLADRLARRFGPFAGEVGPDEPAIRVDVRREPRKYFLDPPSQPEFNPILTAVDDRSVRYLGYRVGGWFEPEDGGGGLWLAAGDYEPAERAVENFLRCCVAWRAVRAGGALVHAASSVHRGAGYLFFGHSGAGKSTLAECDRRGRVVSDDLSLILPAPDGGLDLVGSPFRGTYEGGAPVLGRFPLRAGFRLVQAPRARVVPVPRTVAFAGLVANLPFVVDALGPWPAIVEGLRRALREIPLLNLEFRRDDSYWDAIEEAGLLPAGS